ncbi:acyl-ACP--UDP-N-acetylglucosamine O-acyltransferase [Pararhodospirillum photometricum]|uniref:Acyl-[acyl-carrier-protein]--UDP-N-acetylglucosamine O-acyltransferase n=1 Tax=Pararhodospirillum photometricum DSM 122 TaxID=1150469 RepID=H6SM99_PARPM|nr:acyl-ACP--UDP-N-acetylglucosamine O-acyltransferase [Pararhodospirillum photometricum]CCG06782.1 Acyl-[acyl-carrier-protein]--UDP-N-acetylglucosamine O-acyltransferase [Pararhodospirillum photometricum DSM 122]
MPSVHATAVVDPRATLAESVTIGPFCTVGPDVVLGEGVTLVSHVAVSGRTRIGAGTTVFPFASLGSPPQDLKYRGEPSTLEIGERNVIREHVTMNPGTEGGGMITRVGNGGLFMVGVHVAHDCHIGDEVIIANNVLLGGHVHIGDWAVLGGGAAVHQFVRIGKLAMVGGVTGVEADVIPFGSVIGNRAHLAGLNIVGLRRRGYARDEMHALRGAAKLLFSGSAVAEQLPLVAQQYPDSAIVAEVLAFVQADSSRGLCRPEDPDLA